MILKKVLLRWYRSFNVNYNQYPDRRPQPHPWNSLSLETGSAESYPFMEIPIEPDITTIVGANESGKSHLLDAISKVITGSGFGNDARYERTDLCHFAPVHNKNASAWPHIGVQLTLAPEELKAIARAATTTPPHDSTEASVCTFVLAPGSSNVYSHLYLGLNQTPIPLDEAKTNAVRSLLPEVRFLHSRMAIADQISLEALLAAYGDKEFSDRRSFDWDYAQETLRKIHLLDLKKAEQAAVPLIEELRKIQGNPRWAWSPVDTAQLEVLLFRDVLGITAETLRHVYEQRNRNRGYVEGVVAEWNREIENVLNLSFYWQQDEEFVLRLNYKDRQIYFEITDRTGSIYTFAERSSGLRFFLSYYIQAKALERSRPGGKPLIILMDEPDSFLSTVGQRNMLQVFESLVSREQSGRPTQIIYSTHSPFLVHRNFPRRIRLLRKGDAEEGSQYVDESRVRRYEPVRSALGIDCAQTLLMGAQNVVVEGPSDQLLLSELIRQFSTSKNAGEFLDMNQVVLLSGDSASGIEKLIRASAWGDEVIPTTVVIVDDDSAGDMTRKRLIGESRGEPKLLEKEMVCLISELFECGQQSVITSEDLVPPRLYEEALRRYLRRWHLEVFEKHASKVKLSERKGNAEAALETLSAVLGGRASLDKMGLAIEVVGLVEERAETWAPDIAVLETRVKELCLRVRMKLGRAQKSERQRSGKQAVQRVISDYLKIRRFGTKIVDLEELCLRLRREAKFSFGQEGEGLEHIMDRWAARLQSIRSAGQTELVEAEWEGWRAAIDAVKKNPLKPDEHSAFRVLGEGGMSEVKTVPTDGNAKPESVEGPGGVAAQSL